MLEMIRDEDGACYDDINKNDLSEGDVNALDRSAGKGGQPPHGAVHEIYYCIEYCGKDGSDA